MDLDERKRLILQAVVEDYIRTAEPVGSRTIAKNSGLNLSAATIRNEMGDLEEMGMLTQPHTSAGRIPSTQGYRYYVDSLMKRYRMTAHEIEQMKGAMLLKIKEMDNIVRDVSAAFSNITNLPTIGALPKMEYGIIKSIKLVAVDSRTVMVIVADGAGLIKNKLLRLKQDVSEEFLDKLNGILNENLAGLTLSAINLNRIIQVQNAVDGNIEILSSVLELVHEAITEIDSREVFTEGVTNLLRFPEYNDINKIREIFEFFEDKQDLGRVMDILPQTPEPGTRVLIGDENIYPELKNNSVILSAYKVNDELMGVIGLVGPVRMDYAKMIASVEYFSGQLSEMLAKRLSGGLPEAKEDKQEGNDS